MKKKYIIEFLIKHFEKYNSKYFTENIIIDNKLFNRKDPGDLGSLIAFSLRYQSLAYHVRSK